MSVEEVLKTRSNNQCELCQSTDHLSVYMIEPSDGSSNQAAYICQTCTDQVENIDTADANHFRCLNDSMWSPELPVQVLSYRMLHAVKAAGWSQELIDMMYLDDDAKVWAEQGIPDEDALPTRDSNGAILKEGDNVTLIKDLDVKGAGFTAKRGTLVRGIHLVDNPLHFEGKVNGTQLVLVSAYVKKA